MEYAKLALSFEDQADQLIKRGLTADRDTLIDRLQAVNYYRLSGYLYTYRNSDDTYRAGTTLDEVWRRYTFDRRLRVLMLDGIERIEVVVRTRLAYAFSHRHGPFGYLDPKNLPGLSGDDYQKWRDELAKEYERSRETFAQHFKEKYGASHDSLPLWMAVELMAFGRTIRMYFGVESNIRNAVADVFGYQDHVFGTWLKAINVVRNICAHHQRFWNRGFGVKPAIPRKNKYPEWHKPVFINNNRIFFVVTMVKCLLAKIDSRSGWSQRFLDLINEYPEIPRHQMGMPDEWQRSPLWCER